MILKYILVDVVPEFAGNEVLDNRSRAVETLQCTAHETCVAKVTETSQNVSLRVYIFTVYKVKG